MHMIDPVLAWHTLIYLEKLSDSKIIGDYFKFLKIANNYISELDEYYADKMFGNVSVRRIYSNGYCIIDIHNDNRTKSEYISLKDLGYHI